jgi:hypothetical protein
MGKGGYSGMYIVMEHHTNLVYHHAFSFILTSATGGILHAFLNHVTPLQQAYATCIPVQHGFLQCEGEGGACIMQGTIQRHSEP